MFGFLIENEILAVDKVLNSNLHPLTAIVGGAKVSSKITIISKLLNKVDHLIIGGEWPIYLSKHKMDLLENLW